MEEKKLNYNIISDKENYITRIIHLNRPNDNSKININRVTTFDIQVGDVKTKAIKNWYGGLETIKYRTLTVTERNETYRNNKPTGETKTQKYSREEIVR